MPGWIPLNSAASGAAFAGVLAALVITISVQISTRATEPGAQKLSLKASPPTLVTLMVAAYLYIVLDGIPSSSAEIADVVSAMHDPAAAATAPTKYLKIASAGFALAGSTLALGTFMTLFIVTASIFDNTGETKTDPHGAKARDWAMAVLRVAALTISSILLLGYKIGAEIANVSIPWWWWFSHTIALFLPTLLVLLLLASENLSASVGGRLRRLLREVPPTVVIFALAAVPAVVTLSVVTVPEVGRLPLLLTSLAGSVYFSAGSASMLLFLQLESQRTSDKTVATASASGNLKPTDPAAPDTFRRRTLSVSVEVRAEGRGSVRKRITNGRTWKLSLRNRLASRQNTNRPEPESGDRVS